MNKKAGIKKALVRLVGWVMTIAVSLVLAQEGHPLTGSWSGSRTVDGKNSRVLMVMDLARDQTISGYVMEQGKRVPLETVSLDLATWSVTFALGASDGGPRYTVEATFEDMGSATNRKLAGKWTDGKASGDFSVRLN